MRRLLTLVLPLAMVLLSSGLIGCFTLSGYLVGKNIDDKNGTRDTLRLSEPSEWKSGRETIVILKDSTVRSGEFKGMEDIPPAEYQLTYDEWHAHNAKSSFFPQLGDTITINFRLPAGKHTMCRFEGFEETSILVSSLSGRRSRDEVYSIQFKNIATMSVSNGPEVSGLTLFELVRTGQVPSTKCLILSADYNTWRVALLNVAQARQIDKFNIPTTGKRTGIVIGLACDVVMWAIIINQARQGVLFRLWRDGL